MWAIPAIFVAALLGAFTTEQTVKSLEGTLSHEVESQYNPSFHVRFAALGSAVIKEWYGNLAQTIQLGPGVTWPWTGSQAGQGLSAPPNGQPPTPTLSGVQGNQSMPTVSNVTFLSGQEVQLPGSSSAYEEIDRYAATANGSLVTIDVTIGIADLADLASPPILMAPPSIGNAPATGVAANAPSLKNSGWQSVSLDQTVMQYLSLFAQDWSSNNSIGLKQIVGDKSPSTSYSGLAGGWQFVSNTLQVLWAYTNPSGDVVAEATWMVQNNNVVSQETLDLLIQGWQSGLPSVVAWGPAGTGTQLKPYQNGITAKSGGGGLFGL